MKYFIVFLLGLVAALPSAFSSEPIQMTYAKAKLSLCASGNYKCQDIVEVDGVAYQLDPIGREIEAHLNGGRENNSRVIDGIRIVGFIYETDGASLFKAVALDSYVFKP